jgi:hypothetical protein
MAKRILTNPDAPPDWSLSEPQLTAVLLLLQGKNVQTVADTIGVQRPTVSYWLNHHLGFQAELNQRRQELLDGLADTLRSLLPRALEVLKQELEGPQPLAAALQVLKTAGFTGEVGRPTGPTTVEEAEHAQRQREIERTLTALTPEDVTLAQQRRESDRRFAALTAMTL